MTREEYVEKMREAFEDPAATKMDPRDYVAALEEMQTTLQIAADACKAEHRDLFDE